LEREDDCFWTAIHIGDIGARRRQCLYPRFWRIRVAALRFWRDAAEAAVLSAVASFLSTED
jgi:hypothetical protein